MDSRITDYPALADFFAPRLELGLHQSDQLRTRIGEIDGTVEHLRKRDEAGVADNDVDRIGNNAGSQVARIGLFVDDDSRIAAQLPGELVGADIDGVDFRGAA